MIKVAIFEDDKLSRDAFETILNGIDGFTCCGAFANGADVAHKMKKSEPDVVLMDIQMPGSDGIIATRQIKMLFPEVRILIHTVFDNEEKIFAAICAGASGYFLKGKADPAELLNAVKEVYEGGSPMTPSVASKVLKLFQQFAPKQTLDQEDNGLTEREKEILAFLVAGQNPRQISEKLFISYETVRTHIKKIYRKLHVVSAVAAVAKAINERII